MKKLLAILSLAFLFVSCFGGKVDSTFIVDNPTENVLELKIDDKDYKIEPMKFEKVKLDAGEHKIELADGKKVYMNVYANSKGGIINPTGAPYIFESIVYAQEGHESSANPMEQQIFVDGVEYYGPFRVVDDFVIDRTHGDWEKGAWEFDPYEEVSETKNLGNMKVNIFTKVNGRFEFVKLIETLDPSAVGYYDANKKPYTMTPKIVLADQNFEMPSIENEDLKKIYENLVNLDKAYFEAKDKGEQEKMMKEYKKLWKEFVNKSMELKDYSVHFVPRNLGRGVIVTRVE